MRRRLGVFVRHTTWALVIFVLAHPVDVWALGAICGTVRDAATAAPIASAGIFLRTSAGAYTGLYAATGPGGAFCISAIPAGTYDLEVRVDDYRVAYRRGVVVLDETVDTDLDARLPAARLDVWPQPAGRSVSLRVQFDREAPLRLEIFDASGRRVRAWATATFRGERVFTWDFSDHDGEVLPAGCYFARLESGDTRVVRTVVHIE